MLLFIIIKAFWQYGLPWLFLTIYPYSPLLLARPLDSIQYSNRANEC